MIHNASKKVTIDAAFFHDSIQTAFQKRVALLETQTTSYRLLFGENDGFPGFIADVYDQVLVVKLYSEIWLPYLDDILNSLKEVSQTQCLVMRLSRNLQRSKNHNLKDGKIMYGSLENEVVPFVEHGVKFSANVIRGHKTGYFLDHRDNRRRVGELSDGKTVLDVFSYAGGFSVHALAGNATEVTSLDISTHALETAVSNGKLNNYNGTHNIIAGDAFEEMQQMISAGKTFDIVVIDPPSFAKQQSDIDLALKKYAQLARLGIQLTATNGLLVLASCSSRVLATEFFHLNEDVLDDQSRAYETVLTTQHDIDHPVTFPEGAYLKCGYYRFRD